MGMAYEGVEQLKEIMPRPRLTSAGLEVSSGPLVPAQGRGVMITGFARAEQTRVETRTPARAMVFDFPVASATALSSSHNTGAAGMDLKG
jgi:hypothetical protein